MLAEVPLAVQRARRRAWLVAGAAFLVLALDFAAGSRRAQQEQQEFRDALVTTASVRREYRGGPDLPLLYDHPSTTQRIDVRTHVWNERLLPRGRAEVEIDVARLNPRRVRLRGDRYPPGRNLPRTGALAAMGLAVVLLTERHLRWSRQSLTGQGAATPMLAVIASPPRFGRRYRLHLFELDASPGSPARATVPLLGTGGLRVGGPAFGVWVIGSPRRLRRVAATSGAVGLWPARRALLRSRATRPVDVEEATPPLPDFAAEGLRVDRSERVRDVVELAVLAASAIAMVVVVIITGRGERASATFATQATTVMGQVAGGRDDELQVVVLDGDRRGTRLTVAVETASAYRLGVTYPFQVVWDERPRSRMAMESYDSSGPRTRAGTLALMASVPTATALAGRAWARRRARGSPWMLTWATPVSGGFNGVALGYGPGPGEVTLTTRLPQALTSLRFPAAVRIAGDADPGGRVVIATPEGTMVTARARPAGPGTDVRVRRAAIWQAMLGMAMAADSGPVDAAFEPPETSAPDDAALLSLLEQARGGGIRRIALGVLLAIGAAIVVATGGMGREPRLRVLPIASVVGLFAGATIIRNVNRAKALLATGWWVCRPGGLALGWASQRPHLALYLPETAFLPELTLTTMLFEARDPVPDEEAPPEPEPESESESEPEDADPPPDELAGLDPLEDADPRRDELVPSCWVIHDDRGELALAAGLDGSWVALGKRPRFAATARAMLAAVHLPERVMGRPWSRLRWAAVAAIVLAVVAASGAALVQREREAKRRCPEPSRAAGTPVTADPGRLQLPVRPPATQNRHVQGTPEDFDRADGKVLRGTGLVEGGVARAWRLYEVDQLGRALTRASVYQFDSPQAARRYHEVTTVAICRYRDYRRAPAGDIPGAYAMARGSNDLYVAFVRGDLWVAVNSGSSPVGTGAQQRVLEAARDLDAQLTGSGPSGVPAGPPGTTAQAG